MFSVPSATAHQTRRRQSGTSRHKRGTPPALNCASYTPRVYRAAITLSSCVSSTWFFCLQARSNNTEQHGYTAARLPQTSVSAEGICVFLPARRRHKPRKMAAANNAARLAPSACVRCSTARHGHPWLDIGECMDESARSKCVFLSIATKLAQPLSMKRIAPRWFPFASTSGRPHSQP